MTKAFLHLLWPSISNSRYWGAIDKCTVGISWQKVYLRKSIIRIEKNYKRI